MAGIAPEKAHPARSLQMPVTITKSVSQSLVFILVWLLVLAGANAQRVQGELHIEIHDPQGAGLSASAELVSQGNATQEAFVVPADGHNVVQGLPFGIYKLTLNAPGFSPWTGLVEIRSEVPVRLVVTLGVAPVQLQVQVSDVATLVDPNRTGTQYSVGQQAIDERPLAQPGRGLSSLVNDLPGWLTESNGVLHPRGSEYDVQYVVDGLPLTENRSLAFAPPFDADDVSSMSLLTASYPAEYGRKLGGIVEINTEKNTPPGPHGRVDLNGGSFTTINGAAGASLATGRNRFSASGDGFHTDRYLDPPVFNNFTNRANAAGFDGSFERDFTDRDRLRVAVTHGEVRFLVPNEFVQERAGQRQDVANAETNGQAHFQHTISPDLFLSFSGNVRDASATLSSNDLATPVIISQDRGFRSGYARGDLAGHHGHHDWKVGIDGIASAVHERLRYTISDPTQFDPGTQQHFQFSDHRWDLEGSAYIQDQIHVEQWNVSLGLRFDRYNFVVHESAWSPRLGVSRYFPSSRILIHASYDRAFQTPATENLLLASSPQLDSVSPLVVRLPVRPSRANFYEVGVTASVLSKLRLDANLFRRGFRDYSDDDVLLDTGISFPIAFSSARIIGEEVRLQMSEWGRFSGHLSYANQSGIAQGPITGGLFLGSDTTNIDSTQRFAVSQDQRNTANFGTRFQAGDRLWFSVSGQYGSGLPADVGNGDRNFLLEQYGAAILNRVNLTRGRVRPDASLNAATGIELYHRERRSASCELQFANLTDRLNVINFASLFSGTAIAPQRSVSLRMKLVF